MEQADAGRAILASANRERVLQGTQRALDAWWGSWTRWTSRRSEFAYHSAMPLYEYRCAGCEQFFERLVAFDAETPPCPACGGADVRRLISVIGGLGGSESGRTASAPPAGCGGCGGACACAN